MFINAIELNKQLAKISAIASLDKNIPGILFNLKTEEGVVDIYYNSSGKAIITSVDAIFTDEDKAEGSVSGKIIFEYKRLTDVVAYCQPNGTIKVDNIEFNFRKNITGPGTCTVKAVKKVVNTVNDNAEERVMSIYNQDLSWWTLDNATMHQKALGRPCCEDMFKEDGAVALDSTQLSKMINECLAGDAKQLYMAPKYNGAFAVNTNTTVFTPYTCGDTLKKAMSIQSNVGKALGTIIGTMTDVVLLNSLTDESGKTAAFLIFSEDKKTSVYVGSASTNPSHLTRMDKQHQLMHGNYQFTIMTAVLADVLRASASTASGSKSRIKFKIDGSEVKGTVFVENSNGSVSNTYDLICTSFRTDGMGIKSEKAGENDLIGIEVDTKMLLDIVNKNKNEYTALDFDTKETGIYFRVGFIDVERGKKALGDYLAETEKDPASLTDEDFIEIREKTFNACYYMTASAASK